MSEDQVDNFVMFRYELNTIFKKSHFVGDYESNNFMFGLQPLSKLGGAEVKDLKQEHKRQMMNVYRPPGVVKATDLGENKSELNEHIWNSTPQSKIFVRTSEEDARRQQEEREKENDKGRNYAATKKKEARFKEDEHS